MRDYEESDRMRSGIGWLVTAVAIVAACAAVAYNALMSQNSEFAGLSGDTVSVQPDRIGKLVRSLGPDAGSRNSHSTHVTVDAGPATGPGANNRSGLVFAVQQELQALKAYSGPVDGLHGPMTRDAVVRYQKRFGLAVTGRADQKLLDHIRLQRHLNDAARFTGSAGQTDPGSPRVRHVQTALAILGYAPGEVDGRKNARLIEAIRRFQRDQDLHIDGRISDVLISILEETSRLNNR